MATGPLLVVGPEMGLESLVVGLHHIADMTAGFPITTCGEIVWIILKTTTGRGTSLIDQPHQIGVIGIVEGTASSAMKGKDTRGDHHLLLLHRCLLVADGDVM